MSRFIPKAPLLIKKPAPLKKEDANVDPYEKTHKLEKLYFFTAIVPDDQAGAIVKQLMANEAAIAVLTHGKGTATNDFYNVFGLGEDQKQIVFSIVKKTTWEKTKAELAQRFRISEYTRGIAFIVYLDALCGVSVYKMLTNNRGQQTNETEEEKKPMEETNQKKNNYELVIVIVNEGFIDIVMNAAKKAGARGGTVLAARGTGNKDMEKFFGVIITPEKQIVMILVPQEIRDKVLNAINQEAGLETKGQGIAFSVHAQDAIGIAPEEQAQEPEEPKDSK
jgi:nitrogen regulatory protein PII